MKKIIALLFVLMLTGVLGRGMGYVVDFAFGGMGALMNLLLTTVGMI